MQPIARTFKCHVCFVIMLSNCLVAAMGIRLRALYTWPCFPRGSYQVNDTYPIVITA